MMTLVTPVLTLGLQLFAAADPVPSIEPFTLSEPLTGKQIPLRPTSEVPKAYVILFLGTECPINNAYLPTLSKLHTSYAKQGIRFLGINSNSHDDAEAIARHAEANRIPFPVLRDPDQRIADRFQADRVPEAFVLDADLRIVYRGRIDDQFGISYKRLAPTTNELAEALRSILADKPIAVARTEAVGCRIGRKPKPAKTATITYTKHIASLIAKHCMECHRSGQIGPMPLMSYNDVAEWSGTIREVIEERRMPPWHADPKVGHFRNDRSLREADRKLILDWIDQGCAEGDAKDLPSLPKYDETEWRIGKPDQILEMPESFSVPAEAPRGGIPYQLFWVDPQLQEDAWIERAEAKPGAPSVVHHILVYIVPPREAIDPDYPNFPFLAGVRNARVLCGAAPGDMPMIYEPGYAIRIPKGSLLVFQMHYTPNGLAQADRSKIGLVFAKQPPEREVMTIPIFNARLRIPPGAANHRVESNFRTADAGVILSYMPHMHLRGKDFAIFLKAADGTQTPLLHVPKYDFNWQTLYRPMEPIRFRKGDIIHCVAHFDNSANNPSNPDPTKVVGWGDQTWQEMMIGWVDIVYDRKPKTYPEKVGR